MAAKNIDGPNPFHVLRLPTDATKKKIVDRAGELRDLAGSDEEARLYREAVEQLITNPSGRLVFELLEIPDAVYEIPGWDRFARLHSRPPRQGALAEESSPPGLGDYDVGVILSRLLEHLLESPIPTLEDIAGSTPFKITYGPSPLEVRDVIAG